MFYARVGKSHAKIKINGKKVKVAKKWHIIWKGKSLCKVENQGSQKANLKTAKTEMKEQFVCKNCLKLMEG